jgi:hypothetical protein
VRIIVQGKGGGQLGLTPHLQPVVIRPTGTDDLGDHLSALIDLDREDAPVLPTVPPLGDGTGECLVQLVDLRRDDLGKSQQQGGI